MFSLRFTIVLLTILVVPFMLRFKYGNKLEPYPAVMLPSGADKASVGKSDTPIRYIELYAKKESDESWSRINKVQLLYPIPIQYQNSILSRSFGLEDDTGPKDNGAFSRLLIKLDILKSRNATGQEKGDVKKWLRKKLKEQNFNASMLKIVQKEDVISIPSGETLSENNVHEKVLYLD